MKYKYRITKRTSDFAYTIERKFNHWFLGLLNIWHYVESKSDLNSAIEYCYKQLKRDIEDPIIIKEFP